MPHKRRLQLHNNIRGKLNHSLLEDSNNNRNNSTTSTKTWLALLKSKMAFLSEMNWLPKTLSS